MTRDPLLIPSYSPDAKLTTQEQEGFEISETSPTKLKAMVALPYTYDGKPAEIVVVKHATDTGIEVAINEPSESSFPATKTFTTAAAVRYTENQVAVSDIQHAGYSATETLPSEHHPTKDEQRPACNDGTIHAEAQTKIRTSFIASDNLSINSRPNGYTPPTRKPLPASDIDLALCMETGKNSQALRLRNDSSTRASVISQPVDCVQSATERHVSIDPLVQQPVEQGRYVPIGPQGNENISNHRDGYVSEALMQQPHNHALEHQMRRRKGNENLHQDFVTQEPIPLIIRTPASPIICPTDQPTQIDSQNNSQQPSAKSAHLLQAPKSQRCRRHSSTPKSSGFKIKRKPVAGPSAKTYKPVPKTTPDNAASVCNPPTGTHHAAESDFLTTEEFADVPTLQGLGSPYPPESIPSHSMEAQSRPQDSLTLSSIGEATPNTDTVPTDIEITLSPTRTRSSPASAPQLPAMKRQSVFLIHFADVDPTDLELNLSMPPTSPLPALPLAPLCTYRAPDGSFPLLRKAAICHSSWALLLFGRDSLVSVLDAVDFGLDGEVAE
ncbi:MAG: hypothetical protein Q9164_002771 [Protoblastenia rupestris]